MTENYTVSKQHDFPYVDLLPKNTEKLKLVLQNREVVFVNSLRARGSCSAFPVLRRAIEPRLIDCKYDRTALSAIDHGMHLFEAMVNIVRPDSVPVDTDKLRVNTDKLVNNPTEQILQYNVLAKANLLDMFPGVYEVVNGASERYYPKLAHYAVLGAALSRQFQADCVKL